MIKKTEKQKIVERFMKKTAILSSRSMCLEWIGAKNKSGYGRFWYNGKAERAHRASYMLHVGPIPKNKVVMHTCDNPGCVNYTHLKLGTQKDNMQDKVTKKRYNSKKFSETVKNNGSKRGVRNPAAKIDFETAKRIRYVRERHNWSYRILSAVYGISKSQVSKIINRRCWT